MTPLSLWAARGPASLTKSTPLLAVLRPPPPPKTVLFFEPPSFKRRLPHDLWLLCDGGPEDGQRTSRVLANVCFASVLPTFRHAFGMLIKIRAEFTEHLHRTFTFERRCRTQRRKELGTEEKRSRGA